jgi:hypothetical protein
MHCDCQGFHGGKAVVFMGKVAQKSGIFPDFLFF